MSNTSHGRLLAWRTPNDLLKLRDLYISNDTTLLHQAISITISYESKCPIPHSITSTKQLTLLKLQLLEFRNSGGETVQGPGASGRGMGPGRSGTGTIAHLLQSSATMTLIRFVNGLLDPFQQSQYAIPLSVLARRINLPSKFIEIRHMGTHEGLPSLEMLEIFVNDALEWLFVNYWDTLEKVEDEAVILQKLKKQKEDEMKGKVDSGFKDMIKKYRRIRRNDINKVFKVGDTSEAGKEYFNLIHDIEGQVGLDGFSEVFIERITNSKLGFDSLKKLYEPLVKLLVQNDLQVSEEGEEGYSKLFLIEFVNVALKKIYEFEKLQKSEVIKDQQELKQLSKWLEYLIQFGIEDTNILNRLIDVIGKHSMNFSIELLNLLELQNDEVLISKKLSKLQLLNNLLSPVPQSDSASSSASASASVTKREIEDIEDITKDLENLKKKMKLTKKETIPVKVFETYENWTMKPFGVI